MEKTLHSLILVLTLLLLSPLPARPQDHAKTKIPHVLIMRETGEFRDDLPLMEAIPYTDPLFILVQRNISNSFLSRSLELYRL